VERGKRKSSLLALMAAAMRGKGYEVLILDGDASNPGGVARLLPGRRTPRPLIEFFGGRKRVTCPVDDPSPLTRTDDPQPIPEKNIDLSEIPAEYFIDDQGILIFQVGKIRESCEGCDGPMSKVTRDFIVKGDWVTLVDLEAGIEHFGRGVEKQIDIVLVVVDPTLESIFNRRESGQVVS
jgi:CO dehydrogenase maturation factor